MRLFEFLRRETSESWTPVAVLAVVCGVANGVLLALITTGASEAESDKAGIRLLLMFMAAIGVFILTKKYSLHRSVIIVEQMIMRLRTRICDKLRRSELVFVEGLGKGDLYAKISQDANLVSQSAFVIVNLSQEAIMVFFALMYIAWMSMMAFIIIVCSVAVGTLVYMNHWKSMRPDLSLLTQRDANFLDSLGHIIDGFKEAKLNRKKNQALFDRFTEISQGILDLKVKLGVKWVTDIMFSHVFFYILIAIIVFLLPRLSETYSDIVLKMTAAVLFIIGPLEAIVGGAPLFTRATVAIENLYELELRIDATLGDQPTGDQPTGGQPLRDLRGFQRIALKDVVFEYPNGDDPSTFTLGPVDLSFERGEMLFIVGGNGSGKSTLLKLLTGLYAPASGTVSVDSMPLDRGTIGGLRELYSAIFADFHLFDRLYGLEEVDEDRVRNLIREMQLDAKTGFVDGRFTHVNLSTGQRKRLALIAALLEDREIYVFDEWAADQDIYFRDQFYHSILKRLKEAGKTVIAVTHDDRFWGVADRVVKLELGRVVDVEEGA